MEDAAVLVGLGNPASFLPVDEDLANYRSDTRIGQLSLSDIPFIEVAHCVFGQRQCHGDRAQYAGCTAIGWRRVGPAEAFADLSKTIRLADLGIVLNRDEHDTIGAARISAGSTRRSDRRRRLTGK